MDTTAPVAVTYYYPNKMGRIILLAMEEVMGHSAVNAALKLAHLEHRINNFPPNNLDRSVTFEEIGAIQQALDQMYGPRGGRGLALRSGRAAFKYGLREFGTMLGTANLAFRLLPLNMKLRKGAEIFADVFNKYSDQIVRLDDDETHLLWHIERCPVCWGRHTDEPCCHLAVGILQEALYWVSGGKHFNVEELACFAVGDERCTIQIDKTPLD